MWQDPNELGKSFHGYLPNITGEAQGQLTYNSTSATNGTEDILETITGAAQGFWQNIDNASKYTFNFNASRSSDVYQNDQTQVVLAAVCIQFYIKYYVNILYRNKSPSPLVELVHRFDKLSLSDLHQIVNQTHHMNH